MQKIFWSSLIKSLQPESTSKELAATIKRNAFDRANQTALANQKEREEYTAKFKEAMKKKVGYLTQVMERIHGTTDEKELARSLQGAKLAVQEMADIHREIVEKNKQYGTCFEADGFRMDLWVELDKAKVFTATITKDAVVKILGPSIRTRSDVMGSDMANNAETTRIMELEKRGKVLLSEIEAAAATGFKRLKNAVTEKSDFKSEALALIDDAWKHTSERHAKGLINMLEKKLNAILGLVKNESLPAKTRADSLILFLPDAEKLRKNLSGVVKTLKLRADSLKRTYGEHDWNAELMRRVETAIKLPEQRLEQLTTRVKEVLPIGVNKLQTLREQLAN